MNSHSFSSNLTSHLGIFDLQIQQVVHALDALESAGNPGLLEEQLPHVCELSQMPEIAGYVAVLYPKLTQRRHLCQILQTAPNGEVSKMQFPPPQTLNRVLETPA